MMIFDDAYRDALIWHNSIIIAFSESTTQSSQTSLQWTKPRWCRAKSCWETTNCKCHSPKQSWQSWEMCGMMAMTSHELLCVWRFTRTYGHSPPSPHSHPADPATRHLATTIFWNPTKPTMPAAWLVREAKAAWYHLVASNFRTPHSDPRGSTNPSWDVQKCSKLPGAINSPVPVSSMWSPKCRIHRITTNTKNTARQNHIKSKGLEITWQNTKMKTKKQPITRFHWGKHLPEIRLHPESERN